MWGSALQMAQQEVERLQEELQRMKQDIKAKEQELLDAMEANDLPELVALGKEKFGLTDKKKDLRKQPYALQAPLASPSGEVLAAARFILVQ